MVAANLGAVTLGQVQTFDTPDHHWVIGVGPGGGTETPVPTELGGPGGPADPYLSIVSTGGSGPQSRPSAQNFVEWAGDYLSAGVNVVQMDVNNLGSSDLFLRLLFVQFDAAGPVSAAFSSNAIFLPSGSGWQTVTFDVSPSALSVIPGLPIEDPATTLANVTEFRIFHNPDPFFAPGQIPAIAATLGVDNITAAAIPEPATATLAGAGLLIAAVIARRKRLR
jgi:hypothetical protein